MHRTAWLPAILSRVIGVPDFLFDAFDAAEFDEGVAARLFGGYSSGKVIGDLLFEMEVEFAVELISARDL